MPRFVLVSDTHHHCPDLPPGDVLIHCGDMCDRDNPLEVWNTLSWLSQQGHKEKLFIAGNHDFFLERLGPEHVTGLAAELGLKYLFPWNAAVTLQSGLRVYGIPWNLMPKGWAFSTRVDNIGDVLPEVDILVTHIPPFGIGDSAKAGHLGSHSLLKAVYRVKPKLHVFGHVHEGYGRYADSMAAETQFVNCAWVGTAPDGRPLPPNRPVVVDL